MLALALSAIAVVSRVAHVHTGVSFSLETTVTVRGIEQFVGFRVLFFSAVRDSDTLPSVRPGETGSRAFREVIVMGAYRI